MSEPQLATRTWYPGIEALRGVAALSVVAHHAWSLSNQPRFTGYWIIEGFGTWGVSLFFLLSGFLLAETFWQRERASLRVYAIRRFFRIAPAYYVNIAFLFLFFASTGLLFSAQGQTQIATSFTFTHYLFPDTSSSLNVNGALWTLTIEMLLYAFLPLMATVHKKAPLITFLALVSMGVGWRLWIAVDGDPLRDLYFGETTLDPGIQSLFIARQFIGALPIFALGIGVRWLAVKGRLRWVDRLYTRQIAVWPIMALLIPSIAMLRLVEEASNFRNPALFATFDFIVVALMLPALVVAARPDSLKASPMRTVATWLGERSYSIYLWHFPIILALYERGPLEALPAPTGYWWRLPSILFITLVVAAFSYATVERPGQELGRSLAARAKVKKAEALQPPEEVAAR